MKKLNLKVAAIAVCGILALTSCKKENNANNGNSAGAVAGNWTLVEVGDDDNDNNKLDEGETYEAPEVGLEMNINLKADKSYSSTITYQGRTANEAGTFTFADNKITTVHNNVTEVYPVKSISANELVILDGTEEDANWLIFKK